MSDEIKLTVNDASARTQRSKIARAQLFSLENRVKGQVKRYAFNAALSAHDQRLPSRTVRVFSDCLREIVGQIDALGDEQMRCQFMTNLSFLLGVSNNAGSLAGEHAEDLKTKEKKRTLPGRKTRTLRALARLPSLYEDVSPILGDKSQNSTGEAIFGKLQKAHPDKYPNSKRRTTVRDIDDEILPRVQYARELRNQNPERRQVAIDKTWREIADGINATLPPAALFRITTAPVSQRRGKKTRAITNG